MTPSIVNHIDHSKDLELSLIKKTGKLSASLVKGDVHQINFSDMKSTIEELTELNKLFTEKQKSSSSGFYQNSSGKWISAGLKITTVFACVGCAGIAVYEQFFSANPPENSTQFFTTMYLAGQVALTTLNDLCKGYSDEEAVALKLTPPKNPKQYSSTLDAIKRLKTILQKRAEDAPLALKEYEEFYPKLPSRIKKVLPPPEHWHEDILKKINEGALIPKSIDNTKMPEEREAAESDVEGDHKPLGIMVLKESEENN